MRPLFAFSAAAMLVIPEMALAQSAGSMNVDAMGTGQMTVGTDADPGASASENSQYDFDGVRDLTRLQAQRRVEGPDIRFH